MTVHVDDMEAAFRPTHTNRRYVMSHMIADTDKELHRMADKIGVARKWFQGDHYDITKSKKELAIECGAKRITWRQAGSMMFLRRIGEPMGTPDEAYDRAMEVRGRRRSGK